MSSQRTNYTSDQNGAQKSIDCFGQTEEELGADYNYLSNNNEFQESNPTIEEKEEIVRAEQQKPDRGRPATVNGKKKFSQVEQNNERKLKSDLMIKKGIIDLIKQIIFFIAQMYTNEMEKNNNKDIIGFQKLKHVNINDSNIKYIKSINNLPFAFIMQGIKKSNENNMKIIKDIYSKNIAPDTMMALTIIFKDYMYVWSKEKLPENCTEEEKNILEKFINKHNLSKTIEKLKNKGETQKYIKLFKSRMENIIEFYESNNGRREHSNRNKRPKKEIVISYRNEIEQQRLRENYNINGNNLNNDEIRDNNMEPNENFNPDNGIFPSDYIAEPNDMSQTNREPNDMSQTDIESRGSIRLNINGPNDTMQQMGFHGNIMAFTNLMNPRNDIDIEEMHGFRTESMEMNESWIRDQQESFNHMDLD